MRATRRAVLAVAFALPAGCLGDLPGATGPRNPPSAPEGEQRRTPKRPPLSVAAFDFERTESGRLRVFGTVSNRGGAERIATVKMQVSADGERYVRRTEVTVPPNAETGFETTFDLAYDEFAKNGEVNVSLV